MEKFKTILLLGFAMAIGLFFGKLAVSFFDFEKNDNFTFNNFRHEIQEENLDSKSENQKENEKKEIISYHKITDKNSKIEKPRAITITFVGDMMFDRYIRSWAERNSYEDLLKNVKERLLESDLVIGNLEGPITNFETIYTHGSIPNNFTFTFDPKVAEVLKEAGFGIVSLDNNHIFDYGREGAKQTIQNLTAAGISYFGNPDDRRILYKEIEGIKLAFLSYNQFILPDLPGLLAHIKEASQKSDYVIVFPHWGNEYEFLPTSNQVSLARQFIDYGADIVIGAHPHVIQTKEIYKGKIIYYSLGNFVFDQYFNEDVKCGAMITFELNKNEILNIKEEFTYLSSDRIVELKNCFDGFN